MTRIPIFLLALAIAQSAADPSGHWQGKVQTPAGQMPIEVDLTRNAKGEWIGAITLPDEQLKGLPLQSVVVTGRTIALNARRDQPMEGEIAADGKSIEGTLNTPQGGAPFILTRTGEAVLPPATTSDLIARDLEGLWNATLMTREGEMQLALNLANQPDGTGLARIINITQGGLILPARFVQTGSNVSIELSVIPLSFSGSLNAGRNELTGTIKQGTTSVPLTFKKAGF
jgi:hypothetical protein